MLDWLLTHTPLLYLTQSLWRDEAFSILVAERPISSFIGQLNFEPPVYYVLLHIWMKLFGNSEIAARSLSLLGFTLTTAVVVLWAEHVFKKHWLAYFVPLFFFLNPMLLYYAFEIRTYGWFMFFSMLSIFAYTTKRYKLMTIANILAFYTHSYALFIPMVEALHHLAVSGRKKQFWQPKHLIKDSILRSGVLTLIAIAPWLTIIAREMAKLRQSWYFPVDVQLVRSVLGNMFTSYDGTPGGLWGYTALLSAFLLILFFLNLKDSKHRHDISFLLFLIFVPLTLVIGVSFVKPLFVNRYLIYVTIAEVLLLSYSLKNLRSPWLQKTVAGLLMLLVLGVNIYLPSRKAKTDIRSTLLEANAIRAEGDLLYVSSPLIFFEAVYYTPDREHVLLYNPEGYAFPWYVGEMAFSPSQMTDTIPEYPKRAILVGENQSITMLYKTHISSLPQAQESAAAKPN